MSYSISILGQRPVVVDLPSLDPEDVISTLKDEGHIRGRYSVNDFVIEEHAAGLAFFWHSHKFPLIQVLPYVSA